MANDENFMPLGIKPYVVDDAYAEVDDFSRYMEKRLGKSIDELDGDFVKLAKNRMVEIVKYGDRIDAIAYNLTAGGKDGKNKKISTAKTKAPYLLGANLNSDEVKKILGMSNQEFSQVKHIATRSRRRAELQEDKAAKLLEKQNRNALLKTRGEQFSKIVGGSVFGADYNAFKLSNEKAHLKGLQKEFLEAKEGSEDFERLKKEIAGSRKEITRLQSAMEPTRAQKFFKFFKRMGMSRVLFSTWSRIISDMGASIQNLSDISPEYNKMFSEINSDISKISASIVSIVAPLLNIVQPIVRFISDAVANIASGLSKMTAVLSGQSKYLKVNKEYYKDINEQANKLSFDKFEALSGNATQELLVEEEINSSEANTIVAYLTTIGGILVGFASIKIVEWFLGGGVKKLSDGLGKVTDKVGDISNAGLIAGSAFAFITSIFTLIDVVKNWDSSSLITKISAITSVVLGLAAAIMTILALTGVGNVKIMKAISVGLTAGSVLSAGVAAMKFADGGIPTQGTLFYAGEAGAEIVHTMPGGQTGVTNIEQFTQAMINANYQSAGLFQNLIESALYNCSSIFETNIDGASLARSKSFKNEINRTNSSLNLR